MGCIPVAYDTPSGNQDIIENGKNGFLVPLGDYKRFAEAIVGVCENPELLLSLRSAAMERARVQFPAERMGRDYAQLIKEVLSQDISHEPRLSFHGVVHELEMRNSQVYYRLPLFMRRALRKVVDKSPRLYHYLRSKMR